jgi:hypothetical protein
MSGLLNMGPQDEALLALGLGLLNSKGSFGNALGQAGMQSLQTLNQAKEREQLAKQRAQQEKMAAIQLQQAQRQIEMQQLPGKFMRAPSAPVVDATGGMETAAEAPGNSSAGGMDLQGYTQALMGMDPVAAINLQQMLKKQRPELKAFKPGDVVGAQDDAGKFTEQFRVPEKADPSPVARLLAERDKFPPGHPARKVLDDAITKATTHPPAASLNNYGTPLPIDLGGGQQGYVQPPSRPGGPSQVLTVPGTGKPAIKPNESANKPLTESQAKAAVYKAQMDAAEKELATVPIDQTRLASQLDVGMASGTWTNPAASPVAQRARQAQEQWAEVFLRFKTGAASTEAEVKRNVRTFFPQPGDSKEVIEQKARMRKQASHDIGMAAGKEGGSAPSGNVRKYNPETGQLE